MKRVLLSILNVVIVSIAFLALGFVGIFSWFMPEKPKRKRKR